MAIIDEIVKNFQNLDVAKESIKSAIEAKGQDLTNVPFTEYADKISAIQGGGGSSDLIDVAELPTSNVQDDKVYRIKGENAVDLWLYVDEVQKFNILEAIALQGGVAKAYYIDSIDSVTEPKISDSENVILYVYIIKKTFASYVFTDTTTYITVAELFGVSDNGVVSGTSEMTSQGIYAIPKIDIIGIPEILEAKDVYTYNGNTWENARNIKDGFYGVWYCIEDDRKSFIEIRPDGTLILKDLYLGNFFETTVEPIPYTINGSVLTVTSTNDDGLSATFVYENENTATLTSMGFSQVFTKLLSINLGKLEVTQNGEYELPHTSEYDGYSKITVSVYPLLTDVGLLGTWIHNNEQYQVKSHYLYLNDEQIGSMSVEGDGNSVNVIIYDPYSFTTYDVIVDTTESIEIVNPNDTTDIWSKVLW